MTDTELYDAQPAPITGSLPQLPDINEWWEVEEFEATDGRERGIAVQKRTREVTNARRNLH